MCDNITDELSVIDLGDKRRNDRSVEIIKALAAQPQASINAAVDGWSDTLAAYRFFNNPNVTPSPSDSALPIEEKESLRWLDGYREACRLAQQCPNTQIVSIGDREADITNDGVKSAVARRPDSGQQLAAARHRCRAVLSFF